MHKQKSRFFTLAAVSVFKTMILFFALFALLFFFAEPCNAASSVNWNNFLAFNGMTPPYASNGPGCVNGPGQMQQNMMPGANCPDHNNSAYDLGAVWVDMDSDYIAWQVYAPNLTDVGYCGGSKGVGGGDWLLYIEFDADDNSSTGCPINYPCYPGSDYRIGLWGNGNKVFEVFNQARVDNGSCNPGGGLCFDTVYGGVYTVNFNATCGPFPSILRFAINRSAITSLVGMNFVTNVGAGGGPVEQLGGANMDLIMMDGPQDMMFQKQHPCMLLQTQDACQNDTDSYQCSWNDFMGKCQPDMANMGCSEFCGACNTTETCQSGAKGKCIVMSAPPMVPPGAKVWNEGVNKMCVEDMSKVMIGGGSCDADCKYCYSNSTCTNSGYSNPMGGSNGCKWVTDTLFGKSWCDLSTFNSSSFDCSSTNLKRCFDQSECETATGTWNDSQKFCYMPGTEICYNGIDDDSDGLADCQDTTDCGKEQFCGGDVNVLTGGYGTLDPFEAMKKQMFQNMDPSPPITLFSAVPTPPGIPDWIKIRNFMLKDMGSSLGLAIGVQWLVDKSGGSPVPISILCGGSETSKYYYFVDSDGNASTGCNATIKGTIYPGFEYKFEYDIFTMANGSANEIRKGFRCLPEGNFALYPAKLAGAPEMNNFGNMKLSCAQDALIIAVDKAELGIQKDNIRFMVASSDNATGVENANSTLLGPDNQGIYYTPGSADFKPMDCFQNSMSCGTAFSVIGGGKFMPFEDCFPSSGDEDLDGFTNCEDSDCQMAPWCSGQYNVSADKTAPSVVGNSVDTFTDFAFMHWTTNEPTNSTINFYSACSNSTAKYTLYDVGNPLNTFDDYRPWHDMGIKNNMHDAIENTIAIEANTTYFYKLIVCDKADNCATSGCLNFTTKAIIDNQNFQFKFDYVPPDMQDPLLNTTQIKYFNGTDDVLLNSTQNISYIENATLTFANPEQDWSIVLPGVDFAKALNINLSDGLNATNNSGNTYVGMDNNKWNEIAQALGVDYILLTIPGCGNNLTKCSEDNITDCSDVTAQATKISEGAGCANTTWQIPISLGFSLYTIISEGEGGANFSLFTSQHEYTAYEYGELINISLNPANLSAGTYNITFYNTTVHALIDIIKEYNGSEFISMTTQNKVLSPATPQIYRINVSLSAYGSERITLIWNVRNATYDSNVTISPYISSIEFQVPETTSDTTPEVNVTFYSSYYANATCVIVNATDTSQNVSDVFIAQNTTLVQPVISTPLDLGLHDLYAKCINFDNEILYSMIATSLFTVDSLAPQLTMSTPSSNSIIDGTYSIYAASGTTNDAGVGIKNASVFVNNTYNGNLSVNTTSHVWTYTWTLPANGNYNFSVIVCDHLGQCNTTIATNITITDTSPPTYTNLANNGSTTYGLLPYVKWNLTLADSSGITYWWFGSNATGTWRNTTYFNISGTSYNASYTNTTNQTYSAYVCGRFFANDTYNNTLTTNLSCFSVSQKIAGMSCSATSECSGYCVNSICRDSSTYCGDLICDTGETCSTCSGDCGYCPTTSSGGGSGGITTTYAAKYSRTWGTIAANTPTSLTIDNTKIAVQKIDFTLNAQSSNVDFTVESYANKPTSLSISAGNNIYQYISISAVNAQNTAIASAKISFKVEKKWLTDNGCDGTTVLLNRFANNAWSSLPTIKTGSDSLYLYFEATTPGFSYFAVSANKTAVAAEETDVPVNETVKPIGEPTAEPNITSGEPAPVSAPEIKIEKESPKYAYWVLSVLVLVAASAYFLFRQNVKKKK